ncbi:hypothetical protein K491DRAFT_782038 [Lophiostoma macrostomum CBS 122681]|uniref:Uncharacterized protein n=1 Tax=Lophiostoma macrostomum CBS 122681 TaxID=1314788 RepID=A0A6A6SW10_9PLEO|nr:hypothetical protein K491DRAFT_782038 [Lophiostoma macrostomum CBS 122681]
MDFETFANSWADPVPEDPNKTRDLSGVPRPCPSGRRDFRFNRPKIDPRLTAALNREKMDGEAARTAGNRMGTPLAGRAGLASSVGSSLERGDRLEASKSVRPPLSIQSSAHMKASPSIQPSTDSLKHINMQTQVPATRAHAPETITRGYDGDCDDDGSSVDSIMSADAQPFDADAHDAVTATGTMDVWPGDEEFVSHLDDEQLARYAQAVELGYSRDDRKKFVEDEHADMLKDIMRGDGDATNTNNFDDPDLSDEERLALKIRAIVKWEDELGIAPSSRYTEAELQEMSSEQLDTQFQKVRSAWEIAQGEKDRQTNLEKFHAMERVKFAVATEHEKHNRFDLTANEDSDYGQQGSDDECDSGTSDVAEFSDNDDEGSDDEDEDSAVLFKGRGK